MKSHVSLSVYFFYGGEIFIFGFKQNNANSVFIKDHLSLVEKKCWQNLNRVEESLPCIPSHAKQIILILISSAS